MSKYYEKTKSNYSRDIDHLVTFNNNGLWIKDNIDGQTNIINASKIDGEFLVEASITKLDNNCDE